MSPKGLILGVSPKLRHAQVNKLSCVVNLFFEIYSIEKSRGCPVLGTPFLLVKYFVCETYKSSCGIIVLSDRDRNAPARLCRIFRKRAAAENFQGSYR